MAAIVVAVVWVRPHRQRGPPSPAEVIAAALADPASPRVGAKDPDLTIVVFTDYRCPVCRATDPALERLVAHDPKVRVVFKDLAVFGPVSMAAAKVAFAADAQGRFAQVHRALMSTTLTGDPEQLRVIATDAGVHWPAAQAAIAAHERDYEAQVHRQFAQSVRLGLTGTPGFIIGRRIVQGGLDDAKLAELVAQARRDGP